MRKIIISMLIIVAVLIPSNSVFADYYSDHTTLYYGMRSSEVVNLQNDLKYLGYFNYYSTGYFGSITNSAVTSYQKDKGLWVDGIVGKNTARQIKADKVVKLANHFWGVHYVWGGVSPSGFDCSGFTHYVLLKSNIIVPRTASAQYSAGTWVARDKLKPGDLVFFTTYKPGPSHVGFYLGNNKFIHASSGAGYVKVSDLTSSYYAKNYIGSKRVLQENSLGS